MAKIGDGHVAAMGRLGVHELRNSLFTESNVAQKNPEYGAYATATPGEVTEARREDRPDFAEDKTGDRGSILGDRIRQAEGRDVQGRDDKDMGMDMEK
jgi:hypothetical protein